VVVDGVVACVFGGDGGVDDDGVITVEVAVIVAVGVFGVVYYGVYVNVAIVFVGSVYGVVTVGCVVACYGLC